MGRARRAGEAEVSVLSGHRADQDFGEGAVYRVSDCWKGWPTLTTGSPPATCRPGHLHVFSASIFLSFTDDVTANAETSRGCLRVKGL